MSDGYHSIKNILRAYSLNTPKKRCQNRSAKNCYHSEEDLLTMPIESKKATVINQTVSRILHKITKE